MSEDRQKKNLQLLYVINKLTYKAYAADSREALKFIILNDTINLVRYDRALLWDFEREKPKLLGVSGQAKLEPKAEIALKWKKLMELIPDKSKPQIFTRSDFEKEISTWDELQERSNTTILWLPMLSDQKLALGLWLELWHYRPEPPPPQEEALRLLNEHLVPSYEAVWERLKPGFEIRKFFTAHKKQIFMIAFSFFIALFLVRIPLRVIAPCEVVPKDPFIVTAPLDGIIEQIRVKPGQMVTIGDILFNYDMRPIDQNLKVAKKKVQIAESELNRALNFGQKDPESLAQVAILRQKLDKEKLDERFAEYQFEQSTVEAEVAGVVIVDQPDSWRGKPVKVGEKVMIVTDPSLTKLKIWIPESDNVWLDPEQMVKVILNTRPEDPVQAKISYVANASIVNEKGVASFIAEAEWVEKPHDVKLGVKGTAVLYGESVSLLYYIVRKPWAIVRNYVGI